MKSATLVSPQLDSVSFAPDLPHLVAVAAPTCLRVLVAEDQPLWRRIMVRIIEKLGHQAVAAEDGAQAWELFTAQPADVVITDWLMPGMDGLDLCRRLRAECADSFPYVILASVLDDPLDVQSGLQAGADEYLVKPIAADALAARIIAVERMLRAHAHEKKHPHAEQYLPETLAEVARRLTFDVGAMYPWSEVDFAMHHAYESPRNGR
jgi:DNA-binding response OmpR family regulator